MKKPNFFILGAPKCGTTSLAAWLSGHPKIFVCPIKEPHYFNFDYGLRRTKTLNDYERLFKTADNQHLAVGEASVRYLYSRCAVPNILQYNPDAKFIVLIRDPVEMAYSLHAQSLYNGSENVLDFERAWEIQAVRMYGKFIPRGCPDPQLLQYGMTCRVGEQLRLLFNYVPKDRVLILALHHLQNNPRASYLKTLGFLGVDDDERLEFPVFNSSKKRRLTALVKSTQLANAILSDIGITNLRIGLTKWLNEKAWSQLERPPLRPSFRAELTAYFLSDVLLLEKLTGYDLSSWKPPHNDSRPDIAHQISCE